MLLDIEEIPISNNTIFLLQQNTSKMNSGNTMGYVNSKTSGKFRSP